MEKMTKRARFEALLEMEAVQADAGMVEFIEHEIELLNRKATGTSKKASKVTPEMKDMVLGALTEEPRMIKDIIAEAFPDEGFTSQKLVPVLKALVADGLAERVVIKRSAHFALAGASDEQ